CRIRQGYRGYRQNRNLGRRRSRAPPPAPHPDDQLRFHPRSRPLVAGQRCRRRNAAGARHDRVLRHAGGDFLRALPHPRFLCRHPQADHSDQDRNGARSGPQPYPRHLSPPMKRNKPSHSAWHLTAVALVSGIFLSGCAVGPNYKEPRTSVAASFANSPTNTASVEEATLATWWKGFNDARLDGLVDRAMAHNHDLRIAAANVNEARALRRLTTFDLAPTVQANGSYAKTLLSKTAALPGTPDSAREI